MITTLIPADGTFRLVGDKIANILASEIASQKVLAINSGVSPTPYIARVFCEAITPFQSFINMDGTETSPDDLAPIINVSYDTSSFDKKQGSSVSCQAASAIYNIDCYGYGIAQVTSLGGHTAGGTDANLQVQRAINIARSILMASVYSNLDMRKVVYDRWVNSVTVFQPLIDNRPSSNIIGARLSLSAKFVESAPQVEGVPLAGVDVTVNRAEDGEVLVNASY